MSRAAESASVLRHAACTGGWALPYDTPCPECGATGDGRCSYDESAPFYLLMPEDDGPVETLRAEVQQDLFQGVGND